MKQRIDVEIRGSNKSQDIACTVRYTPSIQWRNILRQDKAFHGSHKIFVTIDYFPELDCLISNLQLGEIHKYILIYADISWDMQFNTDPNSEPRKIAYTAQVGSNLDLNSKSRVKSH